MCYAITLTYSINSNRIVKYVRLKFDMMFLVPPYTANNHPVKLDHFKAPSDETKSVWQVIKTVIHSYYGIVISIRAPFLRSSALIPDPEAHKTHTWPLDACALYRTT